MYFVRAMDRLAVTLAVIAAVLLTFAAVFVTYMVIKRALGFNAYWELEFAIYLMVAAVFLGSPFCLKTNGHVGVDFVSSLLPKHLQIALFKLVAILGFGVCMYLTYLSAKLALHSFSTSETSGTLWNPPRWPLYATMPIGLGLTAVQYIAEWVRTSAEEKKA